jgi:ATP-dependent helicase HrpA
MPVSSNNVLAELEALLPQCLLADRARLQAKLHSLATHPPRREALPALLDRWLAQARRSREIRERRAIAMPQVSHPPALPITARRDDIVAAIRSNQVVVIAGETGSGKTTQIPKMCLEAGLGVDARIGCTQPRRVAALSIARRVSEELGVTLGREVGCKIRFADQSSPETLIKFMTDGILLAETQGDRELLEYEAIIIDEAHERSLNIDFLLGHLKLLLARRPELKLIITSATINTQAFSEAFGGAPIIEVSGRMFPVEVIYAPLDEAGEESGDLTCIDMAANVAENILIDSERGDLLIFMPGERDIRETRDLLQGRLGGSAEIIPLFGRLSAGDQQRVFAPSMRRKIVIATNIAETSLTIPGIRYVIDAGLARVSRYNPRTRTKRLPIEPVSQSSANQRKGRAGRVESGVCIRLYSEEDFRARPEHTQPEIQRANLAEVILRMKASRLGEIETFPFLNPPVPAAISAGYQLLQELGALDVECDLTPLGRDLARLPIDPTVGRMLIEARREGCIEEMLVIAAGLSIQDPRERPMDAREAADQAQKKFQHPQSDFLTLLNIWDAYHGELESLRTQGQVRKFCKSHFLSYMRMREWIELHAQLEEALGEVTDARKASVVGESPERNLRNEPARRPVTPHPSPLPRGEGAATQALRHSDSPSLQSSPAMFEEAQHLKPRSGHQGSDDAQKRDDDSTMRSASLPLPGGEGRGEGGSKHRNPAPSPSAERRRFAAIHRSILSGLLGHIGQRQERNIYKAGGNRELMLFPGSSLFDRAPAATKKKFLPKNEPPPKPAAAKQPEWIVAGEIVETSRLYARTVAGVDAAWIAELARHVCKITHDNPHWDARVGKVLARERLFLHGLEISNRSVFFGNIDARAASEIFIRAALVEDTLDVKHRFLEHNRRLRQKIESWLTRVRHRDLPDIDQAFFDFYAERIGTLSSAHELNELIAGRVAREPDFLCATEEQITGGRDLSFDAEAFPDAVQVGLQSIPIDYAYAPGEDHDGVTVKLPVGVAQSVEPERLHWVVPAFREEQANALLRALPKSLRVPLMPLAPKATEIAAALAGLPDLAALSRFMRERYGADVPSSAWDLSALPNHLRPRFEITGQNDKVLAAGRDLDSLRAQLKQDESKAHADATQNDWTRATQKWERYGLTTWSFGDPPEQVQITTVRNMPVFAHPGLQFEEGEVSLRLFRERGEAGAATERGFERLCELALQKELAWLRKDLRALDKFAVLHVTLGPFEELHESACRHLIRQLFQADESGGKLATPSPTQAAPAAPALMEPKPKSTLKVVKDFGALTLFEQTPPTPVESIERSPSNRSAEHCSAGPTSNTAAAERCSTLQGGAARESSGGFLSLREARFHAVVERARRLLPGVVPPFVERVGAILQTRQEILLCRKPYPGMLADLDALVPPRFLESTAPDRLAHFPRYLKAMLTRAQRAALNPAKDQEKARQITPFVEQYRKLAASKSPAAGARLLLEEFRWLIEEFKVSTFAQELGTAQPVSSKRLEKQTERIRQAVASGR